MVFGRQELMCTRDPAMHNGIRCDYAVTPDYIYIDGRDKSFQRFPLAAASGAAVLRKIDDKSYEYIPLNGAECGWGLKNMVAAVASATR